MPVSRETAAWGMRMLLGVEPQDDAVLDYHRAGYDRLEALRASFLATPEARRLFAAANGGTRYVIPPFLLRRPDDPRVPWHFGEPSLERPQSQLCTSEQMAGPAYARLCAQLGQSPADAHRKLWEYGYIAAVLEAKGMVAPGRRGLGFGTGREPLPSYLAANGAAVVATDAPQAEAGNALWAQSGQWAGEVEHLWRPGLVGREAFHDLVSFRPCDMNAIPDDLRRFDFCWSSCCLEHLGSLRHGMDFIHRCLDTLRPGGVAVHTTEFNLGSATDTLETPGLSLYRKSDIEQVIGELVAAGHRVEPLNLWPGSGAWDEHVDHEPYGAPHLKLEMGGFQITSLGLVVTKAEAGATAPEVDVGPG